MFHFKIEYEIPISWNSDLLLNPTSNFLHSSQFLGKETNEKIPVYISICDENHRIVGQLGLHIIKSPVLYSTTILKKIISIFPFLSKRGVWIYGPIIHSINTNEKLQILEQFVSALNNICKKHSLIFIEGFTSPFDNLMESEIESFFKNCKFELVTHSTYIIDLSLSLDDIWNSISKKTRGDVNRSKRRGITAKRVESKDELKKFLLLHQKWAESKGLIIAEPLKQIENLWQNIQNGSEEFFLAFQNQNLISGLRLGCFNGIVYTHFVVSSYSESTSLGGTFLTWFAIEWSKNNNMRYYDLSGGPDSDANSINSLLFYKKKWGGKKYAHLHLTKINKRFSYMLYTKIFFIIRQYHNFLKN